MRLLHARYSDDHDGVSGRKSSAERSRSARCTFRQYLPVHRLPEHRRCGAASRQHGAQDSGRCIMSETSFGASPKRKEDPDLLTGRGRFVDDIGLPEMYAAAFVRSSLAHARIKSIDTKAALAIPGVHAVITYHDLPATLRERRLPLFVPHPTLTARMQKAFGKGEGCFVGGTAGVVGGGRPPFFR